MQVERSMNPVEWHNRWLFALVAWTLAIFYLSHQPGSGPDLLLPWIPGEIKNLMHFPVFGILALFCYLWLCRFTKPALATLLALLFTLGYGMADEWHQSFIPARDASLSDIFNDLLGGTASLLLYRLVLYRLAKRGNNWSPA